MSEIKSHPIRNSVIASLTVATVVSLVSLIPGGWKFVWNVTVIVGKWVSGKHAVAGWLIVVAVLCAVAVVVTLGILAWDWFTQSKDSPMGWKSYTEDRFEGLVWRWRYSGNQIMPPRCFCPHCDQQVYPQNRSSYRAVERIGFRCDNCGHELGDFEMAWETLEDKVSRSIERKLRGGEWAKAMEAKPVRQS